MNSSKKNSRVKASDLQSSDPIEKLIFEKGLRIKQIMSDKNLNTMIVLLNNSQAMQIPLSHFEKLKKASQSDLDKWELIGSGIGIRWANIDEDLSLKGLIKETAITSVLHRLGEQVSDQELSFV